MCLTLSHQKVSWHVNVIFSWQPQFKTHIFCNHYLYTDHVKFILKRKCSILYPSVLLQLLWEYQYQLPWSDRLHCGCLCHCLPLGMCFIPAPTYNCDNYHSYCQHCRHHKLTARWLQGLPSWCWDRCKTSFWIWDVYLPSPTIPLPSSASLGTA